MKKIELLSPVGNIEMFYQAIHNGADAVYLAGNDYGARKFAQNFSREELVTVIKYAHLYGVKVYVTVNTLIYDYELDDVMAYLEFLYVNGVDAVIMQDMGVIQYVRKILPNLEIHASTQCHNHNKEIVSLWKRLGINRVVLARELSLAEIKSMDVDIEKEVFVYGALCVCYSGCCLFSSLNGGRSGNRGECVGSCRLPYRLIKNNEAIDTKGKYLLSTRELNTLNYIDQLIEAGVDSFKIEGRMKSPYYVGYVTRLYRMLIDKYYKGEKLELSAEEIFNLKKLFHRKFTSGYLMKDKKIMNIHTPNHLGVEIGKVIGIEKDKIKIKLEQDSLSQNDGIRFQNKNEGMMVNRLYDKNGLFVNFVDKNGILYLDNKLGIKNGDIVLKTVDSRFIKELDSYCMKKIPVDVKIKCFLGQKLELELKDDTHTVTVFGDIVDQAIKREVTKEDIERQICKLGNTPFVVNRFVVEKDENIFVNLKSLNELRREVVQEFIRLRENKEVDFVKNVLEDNTMEEKIDTGIYFSVLVRNEEQLQCCLDNQVDCIYVTDYSLYEKYKGYLNVYYRMDRVNSNYREFNNERLLVGELGSVNRYKDNNTLIGDYYLNVTNHKSVEFLRELGVQRVTLSVELDDNKIRDIMTNHYPVELIVYGRMELMVMKYCPLKECLGYCDRCRDSKDKFYLEDKFGERYPLIRKNCFTHILHSKVMDKIDNMDMYQKMGIHYFRIELFEEDSRQVEKILSKFKRI